jgi:hypothetical protein
VPRLSARSPGPGRGPGRPPCCRRSRVPPRPRRPRSPAGSVGPSTSGSIGGPVTSGRPARAGRNGSALGGRPPAGARRVAPVGREPPVRRWVSQSCGSSTWRPGEGVSGSVRRSHAELGDREAGDRHAAARLAHAAAPSQRPAQRRRGRLGVVPELGRPQHLAGVVEHDQAVLLAGDGDGVGTRFGPNTPAWAHASSNADHHSGVLLAARRRRRADAAARPEPTSAPVSASRTSTLQAEVDESTPATSGI